MQAATSIDAYIAQFPPDTQALLRQMRHSIQAAAPAATETISYAIPTFVLHGNLVHFAAFKNHIGFYPGRSGLAAVYKELAEYKSGKGSVQFPLHQPLPLALITQIVQLRVAENEAAMTGRKKVK